MCADMVPEESQYYFSCNFCRACSVSAAPLDTRISATCFVFYHVKEFQLFCCTILSVHPLPQLQALLVAEMEVNHVDQSSFENLTEIWAGGRILCWLVRRPLHNYPRVSGWGWIMTPGQARAFFLFFLVGRASDQILNQLFLTQMESMGDHLLSVQPINADALPSPTSRQVS